MATLINIIVFVLILGSIILVHELGHFLAAKAFGVYCAEFAIGMGPTIFKYKGKETTYALRLLPIGGFVSMAGEADQEDNEVMKDVPLERTIKGIGTLKEIIIMSAGVIMNFVLAFSLLVGIYSTSVRTSIDTNMIGNVVDNQFADSIGLEEGDIVSEISYLSSGITYTINDFTDIQAALNKDNNGIMEATTLISIIVIRDDHKVTLTGTIASNQQNTSFYLGVSPGMRNLEFKESVTYASKDFVEMSTLVFTSLGKLVTDTKNTVSQLSGPAGIYQVTAEVTQTGNVANVLMLVALLSINIGVFNLMPIPGLDGSQIIFAVVEKIMGRPIPAKIRYYLQLGGLILMFGLMIVVTFNDILKLF